MCSYRGLCSTRAMHHGATVGTPDASSSPTGPQHRCYERLILWTKELSTRSRSSSRTRSLTVDA